MNIQFAVKDEELYVIEVNPRASRTVPFVSKAIGVPLAKLAAKVMARREARGPRLHRDHHPAALLGEGSGLPVRNRFPGIDIVLGPEMKSTGEVMGIDADWGMAYAKSQMAAVATRCPPTGNVFLSVKDRDKETRRADRPRLRRPRLHDLLHPRHRQPPQRRTASPPSTLFKLAEGRRPNVLDMMKNGEIALRHQHPERPRAARGRGQDPQHRRRQPHPHAHQPPRRRGQRPRHPVACRRTRLTREDACRNTTASLDRGGCASPPNHYREADAGGVHSCLPDSDFACSRSHCLPCHQDL